MTYTNKLKQELSLHLNLNADIYFHYKGRVSLYAILKAMGVGAGDEVIIPAFTCVVVPNAIKYLVAKPIYVDINEDTYNINLNNLDGLVNDRTKVIICQNTFGLSSNLEDLKTFATKHNLYTIEDCTHGFGGYYNGIPNGLSCDAAFYSMQWNKPFSSGIGGFCIVNNNSLKSKVTEVNLDLIPVPFKNKALLKGQYFAYRYFLNKYTYWSLISFYRLLSKMNIVVGSSSGEEISGVTMPEDFFMAYSEVQAKEGLRNIKKLNGLLLLRKKNAKIYTDFLKNKGKKYVDESLFENHSFLKYPFLVKDRKSFLEKAVNAKIELGEWFLSPIHPIESNFEFWNLDIDKYPISKRVSSQMLNLPTDIEDISRVLKFIEDNLDDIL